MGSTWLNILPHRLHPSPLTLQSVATLESSVLNTEGQFPHPHPKVASDRVGNVAPQTTGTRRRDRALTGFVPNHIAFFGRPEDAVDVFHSCHQLSRMFDANFNLTS